MRRYGRSAVELIGSTRILWTQLGLHAPWAFGALVGGLLGGAAIAELEGLEFILTALFVVPGALCGRHGRALVLAPSASVDAAH